MQGESNSKNFDVPIFFQSHLSKQLVHPLSGHTFPIHPSEHDLGGIPLFDFRHPQGGLLLAYLSKMHVLLGKSDRSLVRSPSLHLALPAKFRTIFVDPTNHRPVSRYHELPHIDLQLSSKDREVVSSQLKTLSQNKNFWNGPHVLLLAVYWNTSEQTFYALSFRCEYVHLCALREGNLSPAQHFAFAGSLAFPTSRDGVVLVQRRDSGLISALGGFFQQALSSEHHEMWHNIATELQEEAYGFHQKLEDLTPGSSESLRAEASNKAYQILQSAPITPLSVSLDSHWGGYPDWSSSRAQGHWSTRDGVSKCRLYQLNFSFRVPYPQLTWNELYEHLNNSNAPDKKEHTRFVLHPNRLPYTPSRFETNGSGLKEQGAKWAPTSGNVVPEALGCIPPNIDLALDSNHSRTPRQTIPGGNRADLFTSLPSFLNHQSLENPKLLEQYFGPRSMPSSAHSPHVPPVPFSEVSQELFKRGDKGVAMRLWSLKQPPRPLLPVRACEIACPSRAQVHTAESSTQSFSLFRGVEKPSLAYPLSPLKNKSPSDTVSSTCSVFSKGSVPESERLVAPANRFMEHLGSIFIGMLLGGAASFFVWKFLQVHAALQAILSIAMVFLGGYASLRLTEHLESGSKKGLPTH